MNYEVITGEDINVPFHSGPVHGQLHKWHSSQNSSNLFSRLLVKSLIHSLKRLLCFRHKHPNENLSLNSRAEVDGMLEAWTQTAAWKKFYFVLRFKSYWRSIHFLIHRISLIDRVMRDDVKNIQNGAIIIISVR